MLTCIKYTNAVISADWQHSDTLKQGNAGCKGKSSFHPKILESDFAVVVWLARSAWASKAAQLADHFLSELHLDTYVTRAAQNLILGHPARHSTPPL